MRNKILVPLLLSAVLTIPVSAQTRTKQEDGQSAPAAVPARRDMRSLRFDPRKPSISMNYVSNVLDDRIRKQLLLKKLPEKLEEMNQESTMFTGLYARRYLFPYKVLIVNPDLEEVTKVPMRWFKAYDELLDGFKSVATEFSLALQQNNQARYAAALEAFQKQQQTCLAFLKKRQPRLTSEQLQKIRNANIRRRRAEYNARLKKEREERLKKLQEENSQKNAEE